LLLYSVVLHNPIVVDGTALMIFIISCLYDRYGPN